MSESNIELVSAPGTFSIVVVRYTTSTNAPLRPTARNDIIVDWQGQEFPPPGRALAGVDTFTFRP